MLEFLSFVWFWKDYLFGCINFFVVFNSGLKRIFSELMFVLCFIIYSLILMFLDVFFFFFWLIICVYYRSVIIYYYVSCKFKVSFVCGYWWLGLFCFFVWEWYFVESLELNMYRERERERLLLFVMVVFYVVIN